MSKLLELTIKNTIDSCYRYIGNNYGIYNRTLVIGDESKEKLITATVGVSKYVKELDLVITNKHTEEVLIKIKSSLTSTAHANDSEAIHSVTKTDICFTEVDFDQRKMNNAIAYLDPNGLIKYAGHNINSYDAFIQGLFGKDVSDNLDEYDKGIKISFDETAELVLGKYGPSVKFFTTDTDFKDQIYSLTGMIGSTYRTIFDLDMVYYHVQQLLSKFPDYVIAPYGAMSHSIGNRAVSPPSLHNLMNRSLDPSMPAKPKGEKYKLTENTIECHGYTLTQIEAIRDIGDHTKAGDLGGWITREHNLSQEGDCWIGEGVKLLVTTFVSEDAYITGDLIIGGYSNIGGDVRIDADGIILGDFNIIDDVRIGSDDPDRRVILDIMDDFDVEDDVVINQSVVSRHPVKIKNDVVVRCPISTTGSLYLCGEEILTVPPLTTSYLWPMTITPKYINIGCEHHTAEEWWAFDDATIAEMDRNSTYFWSVNKEKIKEMHKQLVDKT